jgi:hypothetical protein
MVLPRNNDPNDPNNPANFGMGASAADVANFTPSARTAATPQTGTTPLSGTPGDMSQGLGDFTGWAANQGFTPGALSNIYENPWFLLSSVFPGLAGRESTPLYQSLRDFGADPLALYNIMMGSQGILDQGEGVAAGNDFANFLANLYKELGTPGGKGISAGSLIRSIFGEGGTGDKTSLGQILGTGDQGTQVRTLFNLLRDASNAGMNPLAARGYQGAVARAGDQYGASQLRAGENTSQSFQEWANENAPWLTGR